MVRERQHYHVLLGMPSYMPDVNDVYDTRAEASQGIAWWRDTMRQDGYTAKGSVAGGFFTFSNGQYAEVTTCYDLDCLCPTCQDNVRGDNAGGNCDDCSHARWRK